MSFDYGIMQGRLSKIIDNKIQAFPEKYWKSEFIKAKKLGLKSIEWTLDYKNLYKNPIFNDKGRLVIKKLSKHYSIKINSLTGDCFMQRPFWKIKKNKKLIDDLKKIIDACKVLGIRFIIIPLVDNGSICSSSDRINLIESCKKIVTYLHNSKIKILFESDFSPKKLKEFIKKFDNFFFGINYDVGNSAALNYDVDEEFKYYGNYIFNIHIKDRAKNGKTVRLGKGNANFFKLFNNLKKIVYKKNLILQTARSKNNQHMSEVKINLKYLNQFHNV
jgi:hexulose-6-phosphate isomerase